MPTEDEDDYLRALAKYSELDTETWLIQYFELYKSTLLWPPGLPAIKWPRMVDGTLEARFNAFYRKTLNNSVHRLDNDNQTLELF